MKIGIVGAGAIGTAFAKRAILGGHTVMISNSRPAETLREKAASLGCQSGTADEAARFGDVAVVAVPLKNINNLPAASLADKIVIDTGNYYPGRDGTIASLESGEETTSGLLQKALPGARIVKAFNSILAADLNAGGGLKGGVHAVPIAGDDAKDKETVASLMRDMGFEAVDGGSIADSWRFERARPVYCIPMEAEALRKGLAGTTRTDFVPENSWRRQGDQAV